MMTIRIRAYSFVNNLHSLVIYTPKFLIACFILMSEATFCFSAAINCQN